MQVRSSERRTVQDRMKMLALLTVIGTFCVTQGACLSYELGKTYSYSYVTEIHINEAVPTGSDVGFKLSSTADLSVVWQSGSEQVAKLSLRDIRLSSIAEREDAENTFLSPPTTLTVASSQPVYFVWSVGKVGQIYVSDSESEGSADVKRGVIGLFQMQDVEGEITEVDASGKCIVTYTKVGSKILKLKDLNSCITVQSGGFSHPKSAFGIDVQSEASVSCDLSQDKKIIQSAASFEKWKTFVNIQSELSTSVTASQSLALQSSDGVAETLQGSTAEGAITGAGNFHRASWSSDKMGQQCGEGCRPLSEVVAEARDGLTEEAVAKTKSAMAYLDVLQAFRNSGKNTIVETLKDVDNAPIVAQLFDVLAATQTPPAWEAIKEVVDFTNREAGEILERFLLTMAYNNHPTEEQISWLLGILKEEKVDNKDVQAMMALTVAKLVNSYCYLGTEQCNSKAVTDAIDWLLAGVTTEDRFQKILCLNALKNAVQPSSIEAILSVAENEPDMDVVEVALDALLKFDTEYFTPKVNNILNNIFHEGSKQYSTVTRALAADLLLQNQPSEADVVSMVLSLRESSQGEMALFVLEKVLHYAKGSSENSDTIRSALSGMQVQNYYTMALPGQSVAFNSFFLETDDVSINYGLDLQMTASGLLRKSDFHVGLDIKNESLLLLNVGVFSRGLEYFFGEETGDTGEATAGLNIECMDMKLRMLVFFTGTGELMSMAWNMGSSDSPMPHMRVIGLVQDHSQKLGLQSGFGVDLNVQGSLSLDLGGSLDFSLWDRSSTTIVSTGGSMGVKGSTRITTPFITTGIDYTGRGATRVNFVTSVQFSSLPPLSCLQLMSEPLIYINEVTMQEQLARSETKYQSYLRRRFKVLDRSFKLFDRNSAPCHEMFGKEEEEEEEGWW
ncbi:microsomal triglyceride transfer protein large subunit-like [Acanthaster planci]|uniref:Microsomal triglyceride transfer protein large subunit-like n=1 Tax=Acanthaster planci TaxID=133434 RepID=A0A8B7Y4C3_ACAPL|nr:microsomal triglyceride transfer protein large subunit-like [Acanthaster planci]XP_022087398.1 microsomal triglyceride transfer protein large subunit-like [Acanthaster planci]XP_022087399.1 microsomal triglyceride transfer protein large subunit-like [Acanthaster planci]